ncbi:MAG: response regulator [Candidatus Hydrogenedentes bacterium]|nr:response regulator [Candidatus Hydrogenedentota bacterium]
MRVLIAEDDFASRSILSRLMRNLGDCDVAMDGQEAVDAVRLALDEGQPYALICLDIMMPNMNGHEALRQIRGCEENQGIALGRGAKILITSALDDSKSILEAFRSQCDGYLVKPYTKDKLYAEIKKAGLTARV